MKMLYNGFHFLASEAGVKYELNERPSLLEKRELICLLSFTCNYVCFCSERFPLPVGTWEGLCYLIMALPGPSIFMNKINFSPMVIALSNQVASFYCTGQ